MKFTSSKQLFAIAALMVFIASVYAASDISFFFKIDNPLAVKAASLAILMVLFWLFEILPIYVTALFPLVLAKPLGLLDSTDLASAYGNKNVFLFFGGFVLSLGLEKWDVHKQIAEGIIRLVGKSKSKIVLGFILSTGLLSMWISNTATTLMMLPMSLAVLSKIEGDKGSKFPRILLLSIAYSASIGGMATLVGSPPNVTMAGILENSYGIDISFIDWMKYGLPLSFIILIILFFFMSFILGAERKAEIKGFHFDKKKWTTNQYRVIGLFLCVVMLWVFRKPIVSITGFSFTDESVAVLGAILLFVIPNKDGGKLLQWKDTSKLAWGILLLFGGGLALAKMLEKNGVIAELAKMLDGWHGLSLVTLLTILVFFAIFGTEIMSNLALVSVLIPVVAEFAIGSENISIIQLCMPVTLAASCAFMLPVGTPPNAIVFSSGKLSIPDMARTGFVLNLVSVLIVVLFSLLFIK